MRNLGTEHSIRDSGILLFLVFYLLYVQSVGQFNITVLKTFLNTSISNIFRFFKASLVTVDLN